MVRTLVRAGSCQGKGPYQGGEMPGGPESWWTSCFSGAATVSCIVSKSGDERVGIRVPCLAAAPLG